ncbi:MAG: 6-hydroxymethylpterin diphosphokinase MptE-like protein, partial [Spirochaetia bacterium]
VDPQYWNTRHLDAARSARCEIISESSTHPRVFRLLHGKVSMCSSLFPLGSYVEDSDKPFGRLGAGGSVSTTAWDFARHLGCSPVVCAGLDLGFPGRATHFRGSFFEARALTVGRRHFPVETMAFDYLHSGKTEYVRANNGGEVLTDRRMNIYIWWFETQMNRYPETRTLNLSSRGVAIPGIPGTNVEEVLTWPIRRDEIDTIRAGHPPDEDLAGEKPADEDLAGENLTDKQLRERQTTLVERIELLNAHLHELERVAASAADAAAEAKREQVRSAHIPAELLARLDHADEQIRANRYKDIAGFLMQEITERIRSGAENDALDASHALYSGLVESCRYHRTVLERGTLKLRAHLADNNHK